MLKLTKNGREIPIERFADELHNDMTDFVREDFERKLLHVRCPVHKTGVGVRVALGENGQGEARVDQCCDAVRPLIEAALGPANEHV